MSTKRAAKVCTPPPGGTLRYAMTPRTRAMKKRPNADWATPTVARFPDEESRDGFLRLVAACEGGAFDVKPIVDDARGASVRWRLGHFLVLNDMAYAAHGRFTLIAARRWA